jgi:hypothetical protein
VQFAPEVAPHLVEAGLDDLLLAVEHRLGRRTGIARRSRPLPQEHSQPRTAGDRAGQESDEQSFDHAAHPDEGVCHGSATTPAVRLRVIAKPGYRFRY